MSFFLNQSAQIVSALSLVVGSEYGGAAECKFLCVHPKKTKIIKPCCYGQVITDNILFFFTTIPYRSSLLAQQREFHFRRITKHAKFSECHLRSINVKHKTIHATSIPTYNAVFKLFGGRLAAVFICSSKVMIMFRTYWPIIFLIAASKIIDIVYLFCYNS